MKFSLIICGYNEEENLDTCIRSCLDQDFNKDEFEIIYVDNNSKDRSLLIANNYPIQVMIETKQGPSEARNCGIKESKGDFLVFLDADLKLERSYLKEQLLVLEGGKYDAGGGKVLPLIRTWVSDYLGVSLFEGYPRYRRFRLVTTQPSCNLIISKSLLQKIGGFQEKLSSAEGITRFSEDKEICERIRKAGYQIAYNPNAIAYHKNTFEFKQLIKNWIKGAKGRAYMIGLGKTDVFSTFFRYNLALVYIFIMGVAGLVNIWIALVFSLPIIILILMLCMKAYIDTGMVFQSFVVKAVIDPISVVVISFSTLYYRLTNNEYIKPS